MSSSAGSPHWGGSNDVMEDFVEPFLVKRGLPLGSGKRTPAQNDAVGGSATSDHLTTKTATAARGLTLAGRTMRRERSRTQWASNRWRPNSRSGFTFSAGGRSFRAQVLELPLAGSPFRSMRPDARPSGRVYSYGWTSSGGTCTSRSKSAPP